MTFCGSGIYDNYDKMNNIDMHDLLLKCIDSNTVWLLLLKYELENYETIPTKYMSLEEFKENTLQIFARYQSKAGGFLLEDIDWVVHNSTSTVYDVKENELLFENTLNIIDMDNDDIDNYLFHLIKRLNSLAENIEVDLRQQLKHKTVHILIWANDKTKDDVIGL